MEIGQQASASRVEDVTVCVNNSETSGTPAVATPVNAAPLASAKRAAASNRHHSHTFGFHSRLKRSGPSYVLPDEVFGGEITQHVLIFTDPHPAGPNELFTQRGPSSRGADHADGTTHYPTTSAAPAPAAMSAGAAVEATGGEGPPAAVVELTELDQKDLVARVQEAADSPGAAVHLFDDQPPLTDWDMRLVFPQGDASNTPNVALRMGSMLVCMPPMRAILTLTRCFILLEQGADSEIGLLQQQFTERSKGSSQQRRALFPARVLAAMLDVTKERLRHDLTQLGSVARKASSQRANNDAHLASIHNAEDLLIAFCSHLDGIQTALARFDNFAPTATGPAPELDLTSPAPSPGGHGTAAGPARSHLNAPPPAFSLPLRTQRLTAYKQQDSRLVFNAFQQVLNDFGLPVEAVLSTARSLQQELAAGKARVTLALAQKRNTILQIGMQIQLVTACLAACSVVSGWFGMNLDNGGCGPDGCHDDSADDHGYKRFVWVTTITSGIVIACGIAAWLVIRKYL